MKRTSICALFISLCALCFGQEYAQLPDSVTHRYETFHGLSVSVNIFPPVLELFGKDYRSYEAMVTLNLHHRFMPQVAAGVGSCEEMSEENLQFKSKSTPFFKAGMIYNFKYNDLNGDDFLGAFVRYGFAHTEADLLGITYTDGIWPDYGPTDVYGISYKSHWLEIGGMIKVKVTRHFSAGWDAYWKPLVHKGTSKYGPPYYIPGYGSTSIKLGFGFHLYYDIK